MCLSFFPSYRGGKHTAYADPHGRSVPLLLRRKHLSLAVRPAHFLLGRPRVLQKNHRYPSACSLDMHHTPMITMRPSSLHAASADRSSISRDHATPPGVHSQNGTSDTYEESPARSLPPLHITSPGNERGAEKEKFETPKFRAPQGDL